MFNECLEALQLTPWGFRPYSLRRGGATSLFIKIGSLDRVLLLGRWTAVKTAKIYLNSGLAMLADLKIASRLLQPFHLVYQNYLQGVPQLEQTLHKERRPGGRGKSARGKNEMPRGRGISSALSFFGFVWCLRLLEA